MMTRPMPRRRGLGAGLPGRAVDCDPGRGPSRNQWLAGARDGQGRLGGRIRLRPLRPTGRLGLDRTHRKTIHDPSSGRALRRRRARTRPGRGFLPESRSAWPGSGLPKRWREPHHRDQFIKAAKPTHPAARISMKSEILFVQNGAIFSAI